MTDQTPHDVPPQSSAGVTDPAMAGNHEQRCGFPPWAWALTIIGGVLFLGLAATLIVTANVALSAATSPGCTSANCDEETSNSTNAATTPSRVELSDGSDRVPLDRLAVFDGQPVWASQLAPIWTLMTLDDNGITVYQNSETGCLLLTSQTVASEMRDSESDRALSDEMINGTIAAYAATDPELSILDRGRVDIALAASQHDSTIEFAAGTVLRANPTGADETVEILARSMPDSGTSLVATMSCTPDAHAAAAAPYGELVSILAVVMSP